MKKNQKLPNMRLKIEKMIYKSIIKGIISVAGLLALYFIIISLVSGWLVALNQFILFWYYIVSLATGFGIQIGIFSYLRALHRQKVPTGVVATSGTTSAIAMISCCTHYLVNILPIIGISGLAAITGQYQIEIFWIGLIFNLFGIIYLLNKLVKFKTNTI